MRIGPQTFAMSTQRSNQLSYEPKFLLFNAHSEHLYNQRLRETSFISLRNPERLESEGLSYEPKYFSNSYGQGGS